MRGMLMDVNVQGYLPYLRRLLDQLELAPFLLELDLALVTFSDLGLSLDLDDRTLWNHCQSDGWVLFTENRNCDGPDSLAATLADSWRPGHLPVLTLANKARFARDYEYASNVAADTADLLYGIQHQLHQLSPRIFLPFN